MIDIMVDRAFKTELRNGAPILVRPVEAGDAALLRQGFSKLSDRSRYLRFLHHVADFSDAELQRLTAIDHVNHMAWGAIDLSFAQTCPIGIARYIRSPTSPDHAEVAVTVVDSHQGLGLGTILLAALTTSAAANGIKCFEATVHPDNDAMNVLFDELGSTRIGTSSDAIQHLVPVHEDANAYPATPTGDAYRRTFATMCGAD